MNLDKFFGVIIIRLLRVLTGVGKGWEYVRRFRSKILQTIL